MPGTVLSSGNSIPHRLTVKIKLFAEVLARGIW